MTTVSQTCAYPTKVRHGTTKSFSVNDENDRKAAANTSHCSFFSFTWLFPLYWMVAQH